MELVVILLVVGALLLLAETILPGLIAGIIGMICLVAGVVVGYSRFGAPTGHWILGVVVAGLIVGTLIWLKYFPTSRFVRALSPPSAVGELNVERPELLNQPGVAHTQLRPSGTALINGHKVDVVTEGPLIEKGTPVKVVAVEGARVVVRAV
ncbi:MAG: NfeD family protein [Verrucomicrobia bacterium]|nr:NfeD family protein [Verrucomicrobiota bacterium]